MTREEYDRLINNKWREAGLLHAPERIPSVEQAMRGCRALYRKAMGKPWDGKVIAGAKRNSLTWIRRGVMTVNPNYPAANGMTGWPDMVHSISHWCHRRLRPGEKPHSENQAILETMLTNYALSDAFSKYLAGDNREGGK